MHRYMRKMSVSWQNRRRKVHFRDKMTHLKMTKTIHVMQVYVYQLGV